MKPTTAEYKTYDVPGWEGGIAVFVAQSEHGLKVLSIPRLGLATTLTVGLWSIEQMLLKNKTMYKTPDEASEFARMIWRDISA